MEKELVTRIQHKYDSAENWNSIGDTFVPLAGEMVIYGPDETHPYCRIKIGDGKTKLGTLDFEEGAIPKYSYGTESKAEGSSSNDPEGSIYFVYKNN